MLNQAIDRAKADGTYKEGKTPVGANGAILDMIRATCGQAPDSNPSKLFKKWGSDPEVLAALEVLNQSMT